MARKPKPVDESCPDCKGRGWTDYGGQSRRSQCHRCGGGRRENTYRCPQCEGRKKVCGCDMFHTCFLCAGMGYIISKTKLDYEPPPCGGVGIG